MPATVRVAIVDDNQAVRASLVRLLKTAGFEAIAHDSATEFMNSHDVRKTDCVVTDLRMPNVDGLSFQKKLRELDPDQALVFVTAHGSIATSVLAMKGGAVDFLRKPVEADVLLESVAKAAQRTQRLRQVRAEIEDLKNRYSRLTRREREVFALVTKGLLNKQVGAELGTTEKTVKVQRARVVDKMGAGSLAELVRMADRLNAENNTF